MFDESKKKKGGGVKMKTASLNVTFQLRQHDQHENNQLTCCYVTFFLLFTL